MKNSDLVFVGIRGSVIALNRHTGEQVWATHLKGGDFVNIVVEGSLLLASCHGEVFCLETLTGEARWHNPLKGLGIGLATLALAGNPGSGGASILSEKRRRDEEAANSAAAGACM